MAHQVSLPSQIKFISKSYYYKHIYVFNLSPQYLPKAKETPWLPHLLSARLLQPHKRSSGLDFGPPYKLLANLLP